MKIIKILGLSILFLMLNTTLNAKSDLKIKSVDVDELVKLKSEGVKIIDIRKSKDIEKTGVIPTSYLLNFYKKDGTINKEKWLKSFVNLVKDTHIKFVLISTDGTKAAQGAELLYDKKGYTNPLYLKGGINTWIDAKKKIIKIKN